MKFLGLIIAIGVLAVLFWKMPAKYNHGTTWFYVGTVVGGSYLLLVRPFK